MDRARLSLPSVIAQSQAQRLISELRALRNAPLAQTQPKAVAAVMEKVRAFFTSLGKPSVPDVEIPPQGPPDSEPANAVFQAAEQDMALLFQQQQVAAEVLRTHFNLHEGARQALTTRTKFLAEKTKDYTLFADRSKGRAFSFQDSFTDSSHIDTSRTTAYHDVNSGTLVLPLAESRLLSSQAKVVRITTDPPYFLYGNTFVALPKSTEDQQRNPDQSAFLGSEDQWYWPSSDDPHGDPQAMLDGSPDSWFEIQMLNFPLREKLATGTTKGYGLTFKDGTPVYYGSNGGKQTLTDEAAHKIFDALAGREAQTVAQRHGHIDNYVHTFTVTIVVDLGEETPVDWVSLTPYIPPEAPQLTLKVNNIETSVDDVNYRTIFVDQNDQGRVLGAGDQSGPGAITDPKKFDEGTAWAVPEGRPVRFLRFTLTCERPYDAYVGHVFVELHYDVVTERSWLKAILFHGGNQREVEHKVERKPSLELAVDQEELNKLIRTPQDLSAEGAALGAAIGNVLPGIGALIGAAVGFVVGKLFGLFSDKRSVENVEVKSGLEVFSGWRWVVGIRDIGIWSRRYREKAEVISTPLEFPVDIAELSLSVADFVPDAFFTQDLSQRYRYIRYFVSIDDTATWIPITPMDYQVLGVDNLPPKILNVEVDPPLQAMVPNKYYVRPEQPVRRVHLRASLSRPSGEEFERMTPILYDWRLRALPDVPLG